MKRLSKIISLIVILVSLFLVTAFDKPISEQERILNELANLKLITYQEGNDENRVTKDITLTTSVLTYTIYWSSDHEAIQIKDNLGIVTQSEGDVQVNLTATVIVTADVFVEQEFLLVVRMWEHPYYCHINFDLDGGTLGIEAMDVKYGSKIENLLDPVKEGYIFVKWVSNGVDYDFTKPITSNITLVAIWEKEPENYCNVNLNANGGSLPTGSPDTHQILAGEVFSNPNITPTKEGYTFKGWYLNGELYDFTKPVTSDITLVAEYEEIVVDEYVNVILDANGGSLPTGSSDTHQIILGEVFSNPNITPIKEGYTFKGWYLNGNKYDFTQVVTTNITLVAEYELVSTGTNYYSLSLPTGITADASDLNRIPEGSTVTLNVSETENQDTIVYVNNQFYQQDESGVIEIEVEGNVVVTKELIGKTISIFNARKLINQYVNIKGIITGIIPDSLDRRYIYVNDGTAAILFYSAIHAHLKVGDLVYIKGGLVTKGGSDSSVYNNIVLYPQDTETVLKSNQLPPPAVYAQDVSHGTLDYDGLSLQAQRFNVENLRILNKPTAGINQNFMVEDAYGNEVQIRFHKYLTTEVGDAIWNVIKDVEVGDLISLNGAHLAQFQRKNENTYVIQFMISSASELVVVYQGVRHQVTFKFNNGNPDYILNIVEGKTIPTTAVPSPVKTGYKFIGWYYNNLLYNFSDPITGNVQLEAKWEESTDPVDPIDPIDPNNQVVINNQNDPKVKSYYQGINFQSSAGSLQSALRDLITVSALGYDAAKAWLLEADRDMVNRNKLRGIYDQALFNRAWDGAATWNREHVWPQSKLGSASKGEAHNLRVSGTRINSTRGNYPFGETSSSTGNLGYRIGSYWWPGDIDKGDVARITMYMNLRYGLYVTNNADIKVLYKWHVEDPVDAFEIQRNNVIHEKQGNRNPFIDYPEIFAKLYQLVGGQIASAQIDTQTFIQTNITYIVNMTNINLSDLNRKSLII